MTNRTDIPTGNEKIAWALLDAYGDEVIIVDLNGTILRINDPAYQRYEKTTGELIGKSIWDLLSGTNKSQYQILFTQAIETGISITFIQKVNEHWFQTMIYPIRSQGNQVESIAIYNREITAQINAEEQLKKATLEAVIAQEDERYRISRDLHDEVGQRMTALIFELRSVKETLINTQKVSIDEIDGIIRNFETVIKHIRQIFYQLHPPSLNKVELPKVLEAFCSTFEETNRIHVDFSCQEEFPKLPEKYVIAIYRFIQEGLTNVAKHSKASSAWVNFDYTDDEISISLEDNGQGFELKQTREGLGLHGIRERFFLLGGSIDIESNLGKGTRLSGSLPFLIKKAEGL